MIRLLIVDDHSLVREALKQLLKEVPSFKVIGEAGSGEEALQLSRNLSPDVVLMDLSMPGIGGLEATTKILRFNPDTKVVVLTAREDLIFPKRLLQAGATGYLTKDAKVDEIIRAIRVVHAGQRYISPTLASQLAIQQIDQQNDDPFEQLSQRELQIAIMITHGDKVPAIAQKLCISPKTVNSYRYRIFDKFNINNDVELTHIAMTQGLLEQREVEVKE